MGTKVQCKSVLPGFYSMRDLNEDANGGSWPVYYEDKSLKSNQYYNGILSRPGTDDYLADDKELLKQTMLTHEAIFRKQVYELHRLYRIQRDLMDEIRREQLHKHPIPVQNLQSSLFSSQLAPGVVPRVSHIPSLSLVQSTCSRSSVSGIDNSQSPLSFLKGKSMQASPVPVQNGGIINDCELLESKCKKSQKRLFDLQLPASEYIDDEEGEWFGEEKASEVSEVASYRRKKNYEATHESDTNLSLGRAMKPGCQGEASRSDFSVRSIRGLADLNQPAQDEEATASASEFLGRVTSHGEIRQGDLSMKVNSGFQGWCEEFFQNTENRRNVGSCSNTKQSDNFGNGHEWRSYNFEAGKNRSNLCSFPQASCSEKFPAISRELHIDSNKTPELMFLPSDPSKELPRREKKSFGLEISERNHDLGKHNYLESVLASHSPAVHHSVVTKPEASSVSSWRKTTGELSQNTVAVQALPCFRNSAQLGKPSKASIQSTGLAGDKWHLGNNVGSNPSFGSEISYQNGFYHGSQSESKMSQFGFPSAGYCSNDSNSTCEHFLHHGRTKCFKGTDSLDVNSAKNMNLNLMAPRGFQNDVVSQQDLLFMDGQRQCENPSRGLPWLKSKPTCNSEPVKWGRDLNQMELVPLNVCPQHFDTKIQIGEGSSQSFLQDSKSTGCSCDGDPKRIKGGDCSNNRKIGCVILDKTHFPNEQSFLHNSSSMSSCHASETEENGGKSVFLKIDPACHPTLQNSERQLSTDNLIAAKKGLDCNLAISRNYINLNSCMNEEEECFPRAVTKVKTQIDLEAPVVPETEGITYGEESQEKQVETHLKSSKHVAGDSDVELVRNAAEAIIEISSVGAHNGSDDATRHSFEAPLRDSLCWFADAVASCFSNPENEFGAVSRNKDDGDHEESSSYELDYFEFMTLKLTETKVEEYSCKHRTGERRKEEETGSTLLPSRPRKGQARRGRQRRDFQRDILPGLASLSRHEVTEDLQTIEGLMKAVGDPWETGLARRNATRNRCARGRQRSVGSASLAVASMVCPSQKQQLTNSEFGLEETNLTGWGKTTRRPRRQRCPAIVPPLLPSQVYDEGGLDL